MHRESLLRLPLVRHMLADPQIRLVPRAIDERWTRHGIARSSVVGFNPSHARVYYPQRSAFARWLRDPRGSARRYNDEDILVDAVLFAVHDYLHAWAYLAIQSLAPELGLGARAITRHSFEDFAFCHLLSEAIAVVGLDYWYLSAIELAKVVPIGTTRRGLAIRYHESDLRELRRFHPRFRVQHPRFFTEHAQFYMNGEYPGFSLADARQSPVLMRWLSQEVLYGDRQRQYVRRWLAYLAHEDIACDLAAPVAAEARWQRALVRELGALLWEKVKDDKVHRFPAPPGTPWASPCARAVDFSFVNANRYRGADVSALEAGKDAANNFDRYLDQFVSQHVFDGDTPWAELLEPVRTARSTRLLQHVFRGVPVVPLRRREPRDLFFLN